MFRADYTDKTLVVNILTQSFGDNKSVNYIIKQNSKRLQRIKRLMEYSFEICFAFGEVFLSNDRKACALVIFPDKKKANLKYAILDIKLIANVTGILNALKAMKREAAIMKIHPPELKYYLWFIGVTPGCQHKGIGGRLIHEIIAAAKNEKRTICLETSTIRNIPWYEKHGFTTYKELDFGYPLYCMKTTL